MTAPIGDPTPHTPAKHDAPEPTEQELVHAAGTDGFSGDPVIVSTAPAGFLDPLKGPPSGYVKAIVGALIAGLGALATALPDGVTSGEVVAVALATLVSFSGVYTVSNA